MTQINEALSSRKMHRRVLRIIASGPDDPAKAVLDTIKRTFAALHGRERKGSQSRKQASKA